MMPAQYEPKDHIQHTLCANTDETASMTPIHYEGDHEVNHHDDDPTGPRPQPEQR